MSIGRAPECDLVIGQPWISRRHAVVTVRRGKVAIEDRSSSGTYVTIGNGRELFMHRESALLTGSGIISPAMRPSDAGAEIVHYEIIQSDRMDRQDEFSRTALARTEAFRRQTIHLLNLILDRLPRSDERRHDA